MQREQLRQYKKGISHEIERRQGVLKYVIRKIPERDTAYLERLLPNAVVVNDINHRGALWSFSEALKAANDDAVYVQDDMILAKDFTAKVERVVEKHPRDVIVLASCPDELRGNVEKRGYYDPKAACWLLCTYIPKHISDLYLRNLNTGEWKITERMKNGDFDDINFSRWMQSIGQDVYLQIPNLAGHPANTSSIKAGRAVRLCWSFDYDNCEPTLDMKRTLDHYHRNKHKHPFLEEGE